MQIFTFYNADEDAPPNERAVASLRVNGEWHPVIFRAQSSDDARKKAQAWWDAEMERLERKQANYAALGAKRKAKADQGNTTRTADVAEEIEEAI